MTCYDGQTITYDTIGNPLQYRDGMTFTWQGRELLSVTKNGKTVNYTYDSNGQRISKTVDGETTDYYVVDGVRIGEHKAGRDIVYMHDEKGDIYGLCYDGITHYFVQNVQGDIIGILNKTGTLVAKYEYDAWGSVTVIPVAEDGCGHAVDSPDHIAHVNPFRHRGYCYDAETGFYSLSSRYYDPETYRFINADSQLNLKDGIAGYNMFAYCVNNPINIADPTGHAFMFVTAAVGAVVGAVSGGIIAARKGKNVWAGIGIGAAAGGLVGLGAGAAAGVLLAGSAAASTSAVITGGSALIATVSGGGFVAGSKMIADNVSQAINKAPQVFWSGGNLAKDAAKEIARNVNGKTLEMTKLGLHLEKINASIDMWKAASLNFANVANSTGTSIYSIQNALGINVKSVWATIEYPLLASNNIMYGVVLPNGTIQIMP